MNFSNIFRYVAYITEDVSKSFRTGRLERELQMVQLSASRCICIAILWVSLVSFSVITLCVASQRVFIVVFFIIDSVRKLWIRPCIRFATTDLSRPLRCKVSQRTHLEKHVYSKCGVSCWCLQVSVWKSQASIKVPTCVMSLMLMAGTIHVAAVVKLPVKIIILSICSKS
jgi:hypothetical protein